MNKWKITSIILGLVIMLFAFYLLNNDMAVKDYQKEKQNLTGSLSNYFQLNSKMMGGKVNEIQCETENNIISLSDINI